MRLALAIASFVILIIHGLVFYDQFFHKWERHQTAYFDQARALAKSDGERAALSGRSPRIEQTIVNRFGDNRVDRCTTCHIGADDPRFGQHAQPLKAHSYAAELGDRQINGKWERRHKFADFGCTVCHDGQGRGLETEFAHGEDHFWPEPLLGYVAQHNWRKEFQPKLKGKEYLQANCAQCHTEENFASTPLVAQGRQLFFTQNCYGCHRIEGLANGTLGPDLSEVGKKFKVDYLWESIVDPRANSKTSFMPKFNLTDEQVKALVIFLKSRRGLNFNETSLDRYRAALATKEAKDKAAQTAAANPVGAPGAATAANAMPTGTAAAPNALATAPATATVLTANAATGEKLINDKSCLACHKLGDKDGGVAPDLSFEGLLKEEQWLMGHFRNPRALVPDSIMPTFSFTENEFSAMTAYLKTLNNKPLANTSEELFKNACARCHGEKGNGQGQIAVYLDPYPRDLTKAAFMNSKTDERILASLKEGVPGTSMPAWKNVFTEEQLRGVMQYIYQTFVRTPRRTIKERNVPETNPVASSAPSIAAGSQIFQQRCTGCHGKKADGKGPNSLDILPRPRNLLNAEFIQHASDKRLFDAIMYGVQGTAMPPWVDYGLTQKDVGNLINYLRSLNAPKSK